MNLKLNEYGWDLVELSINTKMYNRLYKTASYKQKKENDIDIKYHHKLWYLLDETIIYFICESLNNNWSLFKSNIDLENDWNKDINKIEILKSDVDIDQIYNLVEYYLLFSKQYLREIKINKLL